MAEKKDKKTFQTRLYEVCAGADDKLRPVMQCIYFDCGFAYATNGHICIKQTLALQTVLNPEYLDGKFLHRDNYKAIMAFEIAECNEAGIECWNTNGQKAFFEFYWLETDDKAPDYERLLNPNKGLTSLTFVGIDPEQYSKLSKALYAPEGNIRLQFTGVDSKILVDVPGVEDQQASISPVLLNNSLF